MKKYIESIEQSEGENPDFIKEEIKSTKTEIDGKIEISFSKIEETKTLDKVILLEDSKKTYKRRKHTCYHDEETNKPCTVEEIK